MLNTGITHLEKPNAEPPKSISRIVDSPNLFRFFKLKIVEFMQKNLDKLKLLKKFAGFDAWSEKLIGNLKKKYYLGQEFF